MLTFLQLDGSSQVEFHKDKGVIAILDKSKKVRLVYSAPVVVLPSGKTTTLDLEWDAPSNSIYVNLPDLSFPLVIAFGLGVKIPDVKGGFHLSFPSIKFGSKGEAEDSSSSSESEGEGKEKKRKGFNIKAPKFGFGGSAKASGEVEKPHIEKPQAPHVEQLHFSVDKPQFSVDKPQFSVDKPSVDKPSVELDKPSLNVNAEAPSIGKPKHKVSIYFLFDVVDTNFVSQAWSALFLPQVPSFQAWTILDQISLWRP